MTILIVGTIISVTLNMPYSINELIVAYCFIKKWGMLGGVSLFLIVDPVLFAVSSLLPCFLTRHLCKNLVGRFLIDKMRVLRAFEATFETHSLQMTVLLRLSPVSTKMT